MPKKSVLYMEENYKSLVRKIVRTEVEFKPTTLLVKQIVRQVAKCKVCSSNGNDKPKHIQKAYVTAKVFPHSIATHSLAAQIIYHKFALGVQFDRQEKRFLPNGTCTFNGKYGSLNLRTISHSMLSTVYSLFPALLKRISESFEEKHVPKSF